MATQAERIQAVVEAYRKAGEPWPASTVQMATWALNKGLWKPYVDSVIRVVAEEFSRALREEYAVDPQGRTIRSKHVARVKQRDGEKLYLWDDMRTAPRDFMNMAFKDRRRAIVGDCRQLNTDVTSYNDNWNHGEPIQLSLNFTDDVAELDAAAGIVTRMPSTGQQRPSELFRTVAQESA
ncbi:MAG: hypothetical protein KJ048_12005 [Dehalococcoidia bacterium]|nr:hypothetical protein [Dehalococcoidia bacterium]